MRIIQSDTPETDDEIADIIPTNDPNYDGPCEWVPAHLSKRLERERNEARVALAAASGIFDQITQSLTKERDEALVALDASNEARAKVGERWLGLDAALREIKRCPGRSCQTDRIASIALEAFGQRMIEIPKGGPGGFSSEPTTQATST